MNKLLIALAIALLAIPTLFSPSAEAGHRGHGFHSVIHHLAAIERAKRASEEYNRKKAYRAAKLRAKPKVYAARKPAGEAKVDDKPEIAGKTAQTQNSSITTAEADVAQVADAAESNAPETVAAAEDIGCKQFFPSVGMTLTVPCE